jgi:hypothetical protein
VNTHRAYAGSDNTITCWVRDEAGKRDLSAETLTAAVYAYGLPCVLLTLDASQAEVGKVEFAVTQAAIERYFSPGPYRFAVMAGEEQVYGGLLEIV